MILILPLAVNSFPALGRPVHAPDLAFNAYICVRVDHRACFSPGDIMNGHHATSYPDGVFIISDIQRSRLALQLGANASSTISDMASNPGSLRRLVITIAEELREAGDILHAQACTWNMMFSRRCDLTLQLPPVDDGVAVFGFRTDTPMFIRMEDRDLSNAKDLGVVVLPLYSVCSTDYGGKRRRCALFIVKPYRPRCKHSQTRTWSIIHQRRACSLHRRVVTVQIS